MSLSLFLYILYDSFIRNDIFWYFFLRNISRAYLQNFSLCSIWSIRYLLNLINLYLLIIHLYFENIMHKPLKYQSNIEARTMLGYLNPMTQNNSNCNCFTSCLPSSQKVIIAKETFLKNDQCTYMWTASSVYRIKFCILPDKALTLR